MTPNTQEINVTINFMKIKTFCTSEAMKKEERQSKKYCRIFSNYISEERLIPWIKTFKTQQQLNKPT